MAGRDAPTAIAPSDAQWCRHCRQRESRPTSAPAVTDKFAHSRSATWPAARQCPRPDARTCGGEVSFLNPFPSFDHLVGACEQRGRPFEAESLCRVQVDHQLVFGRCLYRQVGGLLALEDAIDVACSLPVLVKEIGSIGDQAAVRYEVS